MKNNDVRGQGTQWRLHRVTILYVLYMMINKIIINVFGLNYVFVILYFLWICKHSLNSFNFIVQVYELFHNLSYLAVH